MSSTSSDYADYANATNKATTYALVDGKYVVGSATHRRSRRRAA